MATKETHTNKTILRIIIAGIVLLLAAGVFCGAAAGGAWQQAIDAAPAGSTVYAPGDTEENIKINKDITLNLNGHTIEADDDDEATIEISWGATVTITGNGVITGGDSGIWVKTGTLYLNGGTIKENDASVHGGGVCLGRDGNIATFYMNGGTITENWAGMISFIGDGGLGGGVYVGEGCTFVQNGGEITMNDVHTGGYGGGVYVDKTGTFTMKSGNITGKGTKTGDKYRVANQGGGVYVDDRGTFIMEGGKISSFKAPYGGGVYVYKTGSFTMKGGSITGNTADDGGGVYVSAGSTFTLSGGGKISYNTARQGAGVRVHGGTFTMDGGTITGNTTDDSISTNYGGGVFVDGGTFTMNSGTITGCISDNYGGGVAVHGTFMSSGETTFTMNGGTITQCTVTHDDGGGVYVGDGMFTVSGTPLIEHNTKKDGGENDVVLKTTTNLKLTGPITSGGILISKVNGTDPKPGAVFGTAAAGAAGANCFGTDVGLIGTIDNGTLKWIIGAPPKPVAEVTINSSAPVRYFDITYAWTAATTNHAADRVTVKLIADVETASTLTVPANSGTGSLTFDLDGRVLKMTGTDSVISVSDGGKLILKDSSSAKTGKITGGKAENGGGVYVSAGGTFTMEGGNITENTASLNGGGVYNAGTFTMSAGTIWKNTAVGVTTVEDSGSGGGVFVDGGGSFTMSGGQITENIVLKASSSGGGVFVWKNGTFTMSGTAQITKNRSTGYGGGVMVYNGGKFTLSDSGVIGSASTEGAANTAAYGAGVFVENGDFTMTGGTIGCNHASAYFGGVAFYNDDTTTNHTFAMSGGVITKNSSEMDDPTALTGAQGVAIGCSDDAREKTLFEMSGTASIPDSNTIYLANGLYITVPEAFTTAEAGAKSLLFDEQYPYGRTVAVVSGSATAADTLSHLGLSSLYESEEYELVVDSSDPRKILVKNLIFTVTFESNGGTDVSPQQVVKGETVSKPVNPTKNKYRFEGWYTDNETFEHEYNFSTAVNADLTLYAKWNELYQITYNGNGATSGTAPVDTTWYTSGAEAIVSGEGGLTKTGHTFSGWNTKQDGSGEKTYQPGAALTMTADVTLYAQWKQNTYTVTYEANGASGSAPTDSKMYAAGQNVTVQSPPPDMVRTGFDFVCWNTQADGEGTDYAAGSSLTMPEHALTLYAKWNEIPIYTLAYNANGATSGTAPNTQSCESGGSLIVSNNGDLAKTGNTFSGWNTKQDGSGEKTYQPGAALTMTANITLYAQWTPITYTITYHKNDGSEETTQSQGRYYDDGKELPADTFTRTGYTFSGWNTESDGTGTAYQPGYTGNLASTADATVALYAQWTPITYTITYHKNDVSPDPTESQDRYYDDGKELFPADTFTRTGYTFSGWNTESDGSGEKTYQPGYTGNLASTAGASVALYAQWTENEHTYKIEFDGNDATSGSMDDQTNCSYDSEIHLNPKQFEKTGYTFSGWIAPGYFYLIPDKGSVKYREDQVTDDTVTLKALWTADICTVSFYKEKDDTEPYLTRPVSYDSLIPKPDDPKKPGYSLLSWYNKADDKVWNFTTDKIQAAELHLYAVWTELPPHTITIHQSPGGKVASSSSSAAEDTVIYLAVIPDSGYRLVELNSEQVDIGLGLLTFTMPGEDVDIYPVFELIPSPVPSHSSESQGSSIWATAAPTQTPTATPTPTPASDVPTVKPITQPTPSGATPAPFAGILAGLGCVAVIFGLRRK